jgi:hypothetical protein
LEDYNKAIYIDPGYIDAYSARIILKTELGDKSGALEDYNILIKLDPSKAVNNSINENSASPALLIALKAADDYIKNPEPFKTNPTSNSKTTELSYNAYQCSTCSYISNGTTKPSGSAFGNCKYNNGIQNHLWNKINLNGHGVQCTYCGLKCYEPIHPVSGSFDGCSRGPWNGHSWKGF